MKNLQISNLYFGTGYQKFAYATSQQHLYKEDLLEDKLDQYLFFYKVEAAISPSYNFGSLLFASILNLSVTTDPYGHSYIENAFLEDPLAFLRNKVVFCLAFGRYFPQIFRDFGIFYPKYDVPFDHVECIYLDIGSDLPKVIDSLLGELLVRDVPLREKIPADPFEIGLSSIVSTIMTFDTYPPIVEDHFTEENFQNHIVEYLSGEDPEKVFLQVITFYLNSRPLIKEECVTALKAKGLSITEESLVRYFLGEYIFKGVSSEAKRFLMANADLNEKDTFKRNREGQIKEGNSYSKEEHEEVITRCESTLKEATERVAEAKTGTLEDRIQRQEEGIRMLKALDINSLPRVSLSGLLALGERPSEAT